MPGWKNTPRDWAVQGPWILKDEALYNWARSGEKGHE
jgi:hypothetical protein